MLGFVIGVTDFSPKKCKRLC